MDIDMAEGNLRKVSIFTKEIGKMAKLTALERFTLTPQSLVITKGNGRMAKSMETES